MMDEILLKNYHNALEQKYNAICFDIDGTLTEKNSTKLDKRILPFIANLLNRHIPVVFITGRGETGLLDLKNQIIDGLKNNYEISNYDFSKLYALTNDGARLFLTTDDSNDIFNVSKYIASSIDLQKLKYLDKELWVKLEEKDLLKYCKVTYSKDEKIDVIVNIRVATTTNDENINNRVLEIINDLVTNSESENINLTIGVYNGNKIFQIGTTIKSNAIQVAEKIIGIPQNSMMRIGDCGDELGNDYSMLNCSQGFSVDKTSCETDKCFPILDDNNRILKGVDATLFLLSKAKLLPTICLEHATETNYTKAYAKVERQMNYGKNKRIMVFNEIINSKFQLVDGIYGLYDKSSGSIKIPMYDWIGIDDDNPLKQFWSKQFILKMKYAMCDNENILLRGSQVYYYFLSNRYHDEITRNDITSKDMVDIWLNNNKTFFMDAIEAISKTSDLNSLNNSKMILGILDNIRNELLILLNQQVIKSSKNQTLYLNLEKIDKNTLMYKIYKILLEVIKLMQYISFNDSYPIDRNGLYCVLNNAIMVTNEFQSMFLQENTKDNYSKEFRAYREIDNFAENFITCYLTYKNDNYISNKGICGLSYGGIELPIIIKSINNAISDVSILKFNKNASGYSKKQSIDLRFFDISKSGGIMQVGIDKNKKYILVDDNLLTGKTMQLALTTLYDIGIEVDKIVVVRYPGVNRISQMFMNNHGAIDYRLFFDFIQGLYFPSPYSWRDPNSLNPYEDSLGIFDLNRRKIIECLAKNGDYYEKSEVVYVKRMVKREDN